MNQTEEIVLRFSEGRRLEISVNDEGMKATIWHLSYGSTFDSITEAMDHLKNKEGNPDFIGLSVKRSSIIEL